MNVKQKPTTFRTGAKALAANGYEVVPIHPNQKRPIGDGWEKYRFQEGDELRYPADAGIGIFARKVIGADIDVRDAVVAGEIAAEFEKTLGRAPKRTGAAPKVLYMYRVEGALFGKKHTQGYRFKGDAIGDKPHHVELIANNLQFLAYGVHPDTKQQYEWDEQGEPLTVRMEDLPTITDRQATDLIIVAEKILARHGTPFTALQQDINGRPHVANEKLLADDPAQLREALQFIKNEDLHRDDWILIGHAIRGALGDAGRDDFLDWSAHATKNDPKESNRVWKSFKTTRIGAGTIFFLAAKAGWSRPGTDIIMLTAGLLHETVDASIKVLGANAEKIKLFQRGECLVTPTLTDGFGFAEPDGTRPVTQSLRFKRLSATNIRIELSRIAKYGQIVKKKVDGKDTFNVVPVNCPTYVAQSVCEENHRWQSIPAIESMSETPLFDGRTLYSGPGVRNGVYVNAPKIELPQRLTKDVAQAALQRVESWCDEFAYIDAALDGAALIAFLMTAALRSSLDTAPAFALMKHIFGAGATTVGKMGSVIATGREPSVMPCSDETELEKQLVGSLLSGATVRILDNLPDGTELNSELLILSLTERLVTVRVLGESREMVCPTTALTAVTGVNIQTAAGLNRRFIRVRLDPKTSAPESRTFKRKNIVAMLARERTAVLRDLFTITAAYVASGDDANTGELASYDQWVRLVAKPLVWLGHENVLRTVKAATVDDPTVVMLRRVIPLLSTLIEHLGAQAGGVLVSEMIEGTSVQDIDDSAIDPTAPPATISDGKAQRTRQLDMTRASLRNALGEATGAKKYGGEWQLDTKAIGSWFGKHHGRFVSDGKMEQRIVKGKLKRGSQAWAIETGGTP